ncbi:MAG: DUF4421 family protein [Bdellovibrionales bacterium]|nr:DUF4421 family protein [Bdellovibrionales bacterium]
MRNSYILLFLFISIKTSANIKNHSRRFHLGLTTASPSYQLSFTPEEVSTEQKVNFRPNILGLGGYRLTLFGFTLTYLEDAIRNEKDDIKFGKTSYEDIRLSTYWGNKEQWYINGYYTRYKGLYIDNSEEIDSNLSSIDPKIYNEDLEVFNAGGAILYTFKPSEYSLAAAYSQTSQQKKSGGSWLIRLSSDSTLIKDSTAIIPTQVRTLYGTDQNLIKTQFVSTTFQGGYGYTVVLSNFFLNLQGLYGVGIQNRKWTNEGEKNQSSNTNISKLSLWAALGYNGDDFFLTIKHLNDETKYETKSINIFSNLSWLQLDLGVRF